MSRVRNLRPHLNGCPVPDPADLDTTLEQAALCGFEVRDKRCAVNRLARQ
jgi:hypothetical protein